MRGCTLLVADVHADCAALEAILRLTADDAFTQRYGRVARAVNLGDVVERGYRPCEAIGLMEGVPRLISVRGNHDEAFVHDCPVSGSDSRSIDAHRQCRQRGGWEPFFKGMGTCHIDREERLYFVHGGPLDPDRICPPDADPLDRWLYSRTWQRIARAGIGGFDLSGFHYTPEQAFGAVRESAGPGYAIVCGHEHAEAAFRERDGEVEDILPGLGRGSFRAAGRPIEVKDIPLVEDASYLVRLGIAGPAGYYERYGWDRCYFGVYYKKDGLRHISMLSFPLGRDSTPP